MPQARTTLHVKVKVTERVDEWASEVERRVRDWVNETVMLIEEYAVEEAPVNLGELRASIKAHVAIVAGAVVKATVDTSCGHGLWVEKGTEPHWPPPGPIEEWAKRVLGDDHLGFVVARAIAERGTDPQPFLYPAYERALSEQLPKLKAMFR